MTGLLPREAPIMISADPIPKNMRTDIQRTAQGFAAQIPFTDLMDKIKRHKEERRKSITKINQEYNKESSIKFTWGDFSGGFGIFTIFIIMVCLAVAGVIAWKCWKKIEEVHWQ